jgi:hypothetical protein
MISRATVLDNFGVRHLALVLHGYPTAARVCVSAASFAVTTLDKEYGTVTCVACLAWEARLDAGKR